jgi:hypothetical protein
MKMLKNHISMLFLNDTSSALRIEAINALAGKGVELNKEEENLFREKLSQEDNNYIKYRAKNVLGEI